ncbi:ABC transporter permease [uncultured Brevundimonas sp.]|uniref:ABC transporter permease n=1 Tax=uncultured Brevundimonas sp. TaxID=213418 RepID=UPI0030EE029A|tara:strand:+ start:10479 stop:11891 length:1413 start_codon:yes stop_codon:yes gene_type:complete
MKRTLLIARREYAAYARTVGFWLSLLAFPMFAVLGGGLPILIKSTEPVSAVALIEEGPAATGLAASVREALQDEVDRRAGEARESAEKARVAADLSVDPAKANPMMASAGASTAAALDKTRVRLVPVPPEIVASVPGEAQDALLRRYLGDETPKAQRLDAVVFLTRVDGQPAARVWTAGTTNSRVESFVRNALRSANRRQVFESAGIDPAVVSATERFDPAVTAFSPRSISGGELSFRDRAPAFIGLAAGFILWSLIITGASILLNSVMEEKSNRILEVLLSSASATEILTGKVLGVALLTLTVMLAWGGIGSAALIAFAPERAVDIGQVLLHGGMLGYFGAYMVGGYLMYAVLFAAIGAFCETPRDAQTLMGPIMMVLVVPIIVMQMALQTPDAPVVKILSWIPFFTPFLMIARMPSDPPMIEIAGTMGGMFVTALFMVWAAGRAFRAGALSDIKLSWKSFAGAVRGGR